MIKNNWFILGWLLPLLMMPGSYSSFTISSYAKFNDGEILPANQRDTSIRHHWLKADSLRLDTIGKYFDTPPADCRPKVFWDWMGGMISKEGITKDLEALAAQGVGGVMVMQLGDQVTGIPITYSDYPGKIKCLSDEWFEMVNYAIKETDRLGLTFSIFLCPGWSHAGAPWITPEKGLKKLQDTSIEVTGPFQFDNILPRGNRLIGTGAATAAFYAKSKTIKPEFYKDVAVIAVPNSRDSSMPSIKDIVDITHYMDTEGRLKWNVPAGSWRIVRLGITSENGVNHPAPFEATGLECDRMDTSALHLVFDGIIRRILKEAKAKGYKSFKAFETDSYEGGFQDFCLDFPEQFKRRRKYDCVPWLPAWTDSKLVIGSSQITQRFRYDMMRTISELTAERFHGELRRLADENGVVWQTEPYWGMSIDWRTSGARSTLPGSEFWVNGMVVSSSRKNISDTWKWMEQTGQLIGAAPDIAALYDLPVVWAESFTAESFNSAWRNDPWLLKPWGDAAFCKGINQFYIHGFTHNPFDDRYQPGVTMGFWGTQMNRHMTWWPYSSSWHRYLARCQFMLRQGKPVYDMLAYPSDTRSISGPVVDAEPFRQVVLNDESLFRLSVDNGQIVVKGGNKFAALILQPNTPLLPEALRKIRDLVKDGATLIAVRPPTTSPSLENYPACDNEITKLVNEIWGDEGNGTWNERTLGKGKILTTTNFSKALNILTGGPDVQFSAKSDQQVKYLNYVHRRDGNTEIYFVCNTGDEAVNARVDFRVIDGIPEQWDPVTGEKRTFSDLEKNGGRTQLRLRFEPRQSFFIIFKKEHNETTAGNIILSPLKSLVEIQGSWDVSFDPKWSRVTKIKFDKLQDWTKRPEKAIKYYSGSAIYRKSFDLPSFAEIRKASSHLYLDLGVMYNLARVSLNGKDLGVIWCAPWRLPVPSGLLKKEGNILNITVVNTWVNRLIGDEQQPEDCELVEYDAPGNRKGSYDKNIPSRRLKDLPDWLIKGMPRPSTGRYTFSTWRFYDKNAPLLPAGLLGPVKLMF